MSKIKVYQTRENGIVKLGAKVHDPAANLNDLLEAWQPLCDDESIYKNYGQGHHSACKGCPNNCCYTAYVIPDIISFKSMADQLQITEAEFVQGWFQPDKLALGLLKIKSNPCIFLQDGICSIYPLRSLICRFYICSDLTWDTEQLIYSLAWSGAAAAQIYAEQQGYVPSPGPGGYTSFDRLFVELVEAYRVLPGVKAFLAADSYQDIPLHHFIKAD